MSTQSKVDLSKVTARPWVNDGGLVYGRDDIGAPSFDIFDASEWPGGENEAQANAALIVQAVNSFSVMREALRAIVDAWAVGDSTGVELATAIDKADLALKLAEGGE